MKRRRLLKKVMSLMLILVMVVSMIPSLAMAAEADTGSIKVYFKLPADASVSDWGINAWGTDVTVAGNDEVKVSPTAWEGEEFPSLLAESNAEGWGYATISGTVSGLHFVSVDGALDNKDYWSRAITLNNLNTVYFDTTSSKWYMDADCTQEVTLPEGTPTSTDLTIHFKNERNWEQVYSKFAAGGSWTSIKDYEYCNEEYGGLLEENEDNKGWYSFRIQKEDAETVNGFFNCGQWGGTNQTPNFSIDIDKEVKEVWITYKNVDATDEEDDSNKDDYNKLVISEEKPEDWVVNTEGGYIVKKPIDPSTLEEENPIKTTDLTLHFKNEYEWETVKAYFGAGASWNPISDYEYCNNADGAQLEENSMNKGWYSFRIQKADNKVVNGNFNSGAWLKQTGNYEIKITAEQMEVWLTLKDASVDKSDIVVSDTAPEGWVEGSKPGKPINPADISNVKSPVTNEDGSVTFNYEISAEALGEDKVYLMGTVTDWDNGKEMADEDGDGIWSVTLKDLKPGRYQYKFKYGGTWVTDPMNKELESGNSLLIVEGFLINCENPAGSGSFEVTAEITDNIKKDTIVWSVTDAKGEALTGMSITPDPEDKTKAVLNVKDEAKTGDFNIVADYTDDKGDKNASLSLYYTEKAVLYEYEYKADSVNTGKSDIYTWYNSKAGNVGAKFREVNGKYTAYVTLDSTTSNFGYIIRLFGMWGADENTDREFKDRTLYVNMEDRYTKVRGGEGIEVPYTLPSGKTSYDNGIVFKWRDDERFYNNTMNELKDTEVKVILQKKDSAKEIIKQMTYNDEDELFTYKYTTEDGLEDGTYSFYFTVDGERKDDQYWNGEIEYKKPILDIITTVTPTDGVNYNENPTVSFDIKENGTDKDVEISAITADISELGYEGTKVSFQPLSKKGVLYVDRSVAPGKYTVPFTVTDTFGNDTKVDVGVKVTERNASDAAWDESRVYFLLTDRFVNGDTSNDYECAGDKIEAYHGGDFAGLTSKLAYLQELGINTIWITPIVDNVEAIMNEDLHQQAYHGYWAKDFEKVDEHLGDTKALDALIDEAASRGIKIMVDIVVNHAGYGTDNQDNFAGMLRGDDEVKGDVILGCLDNLPDFKTEEEAVRAKLIKWQTAWANHTTAAGNSIAYFRVDTVKHVDHETWQDLKTSLSEVNPAFKMIGEYFGAGVSNTGDYLGNGQMDALLDFEFKDTARSFVNGNIDAVESTLENRNAALTNSNTLGQFLSSHDEDGFLYNLDGDVAKMKVAAALQLTAKGIPIVYYGEEINLTGPNAFGDQKNNRYDMQFEDLTEEQTAMLNHYKKLLAARTMYSAIFATGSRVKVDGSDADGYLVFKRSLGNENVYVGLNTTGTAKKVTFDVAETESLFDVYNQKNVPIAEGKVTVTIPANADGGTVILAKRKILTDVIFNAPNKTAFAVGDKLNLDGLTVTGVYGDVKVPITSYKVYTSKVDMSKEGTYKVIVGYDKYFEEFAITVGKTDEPSKPDPSEIDPPKTDPPKTETPVVQNPGDNKNSDVKVTKITISGMSNKIAAGRKIALTANITPGNASNKSVTWSTSNNKYGTVNSKGVVTTKKAGSGHKVTITASANDGSNKKATYNISIMKDKVKSIKLKASTKSVKAGGKVTVKATVKTTGKKANRTLAWSSSNKKYATVSKKGVVTTKKAGKGKKVTITAKATDGTGKKATFKIEIK